MHLARESSFLCVFVSLWFNFCFHWNRSAEGAVGSYPGYAFTDAPLKLAAGHFGLGYGTDQHAPDEFYLIESMNPKVQGYHGATLSHVEYLYELAK